MKDRPDPRPESASAAQAGIHFVEHHRCGGFIESLPFLEAIRQFAKSWVPTTSPTPPPTPQRRPPGLRPSGDAGAEPWDSQLVDPLVAAVISGQFQTDSSQGGVIGIQ